MTMDATSEPGRRRDARSSRSAGVSKVFAADGQGRAPVEALVGIDLSRRAPASSSR